MISRLRMLLQLPGMRASALRIRPLSSAPLLPPALAVVRSRARIIAGGAALAAASLYYFLSTESEAGVVSDMCGVFEAGGAEGWDAGFFNDARALVERPVVEANLAKRSRVATSIMTLRAGTPERRKSCRIANPSASMSPQ